jgi:hypothetical protein
MKFAKDFGENWTLEVFRIQKVLRRSPRSVSDLEDMRGELIDGQFYAEKLTPVKITSRTVYLVGKILVLRVTRGSREYVAS